MPDILSDDIGSVPLPAGADKEELRRIASDLAAGKAAGGKKEIFNKIVGDLMQEKIDSGIMRPNYPQVQDMITSFGSLIEDHSEEDEPWVVKKEYAVIPEISAITETAKRFFKDTGEPLRFRVCVTGPLELYLKKVGGSIQPDLLMNLAKSVSRFIENSRIDTPYMKTALYSIDEPSLGLNPNLAVDNDVLADAWNLSTKKAKGIDVEMHLHSPKALDRLYGVEGINVLGVEYAANPKALGYVDKGEVESYDKFLRIGIARTDIQRLASEYGERFGTDYWKDKDKNRLTSEIENVRNITKRLEKAYAALGDRIKYAGPDCGRGSWPDQESTYRLLKNAAKAVSEFNASNR